MPDRPDDPDAAPGAASPKRDDSGAAPDADSRTRRARLHGFVDRHVRVPSSAAGFLLALIIVGGLGTVVALGGAAFQKWSETAGFCSQCHTMAAETAANRMSVHRGVTCGECHVEPGVVGFVKSKIRGSIQLFEVVTHSYPTPIAEPDHGLLPPTRDTCMKCHTLSEISKQGTPIKLVLHNVYREDEANTKETVALMVRPYRLGEGEASRGAHWHVEDKVEYASPDKNSQTINWIRVTYKDGRTEEFIARSQVGVSAEVQPDIKRLLRTETVRTMDCISCHNRVGHEIPTPNEAINAAMAEDKISPALPYIKREGVARLGKNYRSVTEADKAIEGLRTMYALDYPLVSKTREPEVNKAVRQLKVIYRLVATPEMNEIAADYPNNLGHQTGPGCFRCHDGAHFAVASSGRLLNKTVPWECTTCHTFPQVGKTVTSLTVLAPPPDHQSKLWVFNHASTPLALEPSANSAFCENCHSSGLGKVTHEEMLYHHPQVIEKTGLQECYYCHQQAFCARCHKPGPGPVRSGVHGEAGPLITGKLE